MSKTVSILQSSYIPWKGYFDIIGKVDEFILFDDAQFTKNDWRNRNRIKTPSGSQWISIPVQQSGRFGQKIRDTVVSDSRWRRRHWQTLNTVYGAAPHFKTVSPRLEPLYLDQTETRLSQINRDFLSTICDILGIETTLSWSWEYGVIDGRTERLVDLCKKAGATAYLTGPRARDYLDEDLFAREGISLSYMSYEGYPLYPQLHPPFDHHVSILDLLFVMGPKAGEYMLSMGENSE